MKFLKSPSAICNESLGNYNDHVIIFWFAFFFSPVSCHNEWFGREIVCELQKSAFLQENPRLFIYVYNLQSYVVL